MRLIFILLLSLSLSQLFAQQTRTLSLEECLLIIRSESPNAEIAQFNFEEAENNYQAYQYGLLPQLTLFANLPGLTRSITGITQDDGSTLFQPQSQLFSSANLGFSQALPFTGGRITLFSGLSNFQLLEDNELSLWRTSPISISYSQPLFQPNRIKFGLDNVKAQYQLAQVSKLQDIEQAAVDLTLIYFDAITSLSELQQAEINVRNNDTIFKISEGRFSVGKIAENELLQSELSLMNARADKQRAELQYEQSLQQLRRLLGMGEDQALELVVPENLPPVNVDPDFAVAQAMKYSRLVQSGKVNALNAAQQVKEARADNRFNADITASFGLNQTGSDLSEAYKNPINQQSFSVGLNLPIFQWGSGKAEVDARLARQKAIIMSQEQAELNFGDDIRYRVLTLDQLRTQLDISARSDTIARKRYTITKNRYLIGKVSIQDLFIAQDERDRARLQHVNNLRNFWVALARLRADTLFDFAKGQPVE
ncbi:MAG: TolC family protein [Bacteroidia bacterium]|nr:TolC family protein [Bacteroidia bacterium]